MIFISVTCFKLILHFWNTKTFEELKKKKEKKAVPNVQELTM